MPRFRESGHSKPATDRFRNPFRSFRNLPARVGDCNAGLMRIALTGSTGKLGTVVARELRERNRQDRKIDAGDAEAEREEADEGPGKRRDGNRQRQPEPRRDAEMNVKRGGGIGAEADIERMAERKLAGEPHHDVPRLRGVGEVEDQDQDGEQIVVHHQRRRQQHGQEHSQHHGGAAREAVEQGFDRTENFTYGMVYLAYSY